MRVSPRRIAFVLSLTLALFIAGCSQEQHLSAVNSDETTSVTQIKNAPAGYYDTADETTSSSLRSSLHEIIDDHTRIPYTSTATDTWNVLEEADEDPNNSSNVLDVYLNESYQKWGAGNNDYNREHSWPKSYGFPSDGSTNYPYSDCHHLFICNDSRNSSRGNKPYNDVGGTGTEYTTVVNNGVGGGSGSYPGWSNWADTTYWETWWDQRGDVARALMYLDVRYEGGTHGITSVNEPDLILTDNLSLIQNSNTGSNESVAYMGSLTALMQWNLDDPVDAKEMAHNDAVYGHQGNRNPFVDHPEWVECIFGSSCTPPVGGGGDVWINEFHYDNAGGDTGEFFEVAGEAGTSLSGWSVVAYNGSNGTSYSTVNLSGTLADQQGGIGTLSFNLSGMQNGAPDGLALVDDGGVVIEFISYEGSFSATNGAASGQTSVDVGVAESNSTTVGFSLQLGGTGSTAGDFAWQAEQANTSGAVNTGQTFAGGGGGTNQAPTANANGSYNAEAGISVSFSSSGSSDTDGTITNWAWTFGDGGSSSQANPSHTYASAGVFTVTLTVTDDGGATDDDVTSATIVDTTAPAAPSALTGTAGDAVVGLNWANNGEADLDGYTVYRGTSSGGPYSALNGSLLSASDYSDATVSNGTTYYFVVTASDVTGNESAYSSEVAGSPAASTGGAEVWINEFHYDNSGTDRNEFVEIAGTAGTDLTGWTIVAHNGSDGTAYKTVTLSGTLSNQQGGFGTYDAVFSGLQNGAPDGFALVDDTGTVVQFLSYEGSFTAVGGAANGLTSTDVGVSETSSTQKGWSLQLGGTGGAYADFTWQSPLRDTDGAVNKNQTFQ